MLFGGYTPIIFSRGLVRCASCVMHRLSVLENKYSNIFFYKTIALTVLKFYMEQNLAQGSQNYKIGSGRISKMAAITKRKCLLPAGWQETFWSPASRLVGDLKSPASRLLRYW